MYTFAFTQLNGQSFVTWGESYIFDHEKEEIRLFDEAERPLKVYNFKSDALRRIDIYPCYENVNGPIQTYLRSPA